MAALCQKWADELAALDCANDSAALDEEEVRALLTKSQKLIRVVQAGLRRGELETVPRELVQEEYKLCLVAARQATRAAGKRRTTDRIIDAMRTPTRYDLDETGTARISRKFTVTAEATDKVREQIHAAHTTPSEIAYALAGARFGIPTETARQLATGKRKSPKRRRRFDLPIGLLASSFYDMCQHNRQSRSISRVEAFDALWKCGYSRFCLFYRLHHADVSDNQLPSLIEANDMELLLDYVRTQKLPASAD